MDYLHLLLTNTKKPISHVITLTLDRHKRN